MAQPIPTMMLPTKEACEDYKLRRFHSDYDTLSGDGKGNSGANSGFLSDAFDNLVSLGENAIGIDIPGLGPPGIEDQKMFLAGPQFKNKPGNILQEPIAQFSLGFYNGPQSSWWIAKRQQNKPVESGDPIGEARTTNSVWVTAKKNVPYKVKPKTETVNGKTITVSEYDYSGKAVADILWKMNILPNWNHEESMDFSHDHEWGTPQDMFSQMFSKIGSALSGANKLAERIKNSGTDNNNTGALAQIKADIAATYQQTNRLEITVPFTLFTKNNFYRDIFYPIMTMNSLTFPKRLTATEAAKHLIEASQGIIDGVASGLDATKGLTGVDGSVVPENLGETGGQSTEDFLNNIMPGFRIFANEPPSYFNIEHSAGLFKFDNCAVTKFEYKYKGPWVTTTNLPQDKTAFGDRLDEQGNVLPSSAVRPQKKDFWKFWKTENDILDTTWTRAKMTYPLIAECMITFKVLDPLFSDDWINQLVIYNGIWDGINDESFTSAGQKPGTDLLNLGGLI